MAAEAERATRSREQTSVAPRIPPPPDSLAATAAACVAQHESAFQCASESLRVEDPRGLIERHPVITDPLAAISELIRRGRDVRDSLDVVLAFLLEAAADEQATGDLSTSYALLKVIMQEHDAIGRAMEMLREVRWDQDRRAKALISAGETE